MISEILKDKTRFEHTTLEEKMNSEGIISGNFSVEDYNRMLEMNYRFLLNFENEVFDLIPERVAEKINLENRRKFPSIEIDILSSGVRISDEKAHEKIINYPQAMGVFYVMEGATLGGNMMVKNLKKIPDFAEMTFNFFGIYGSQTGEMWQKFKTVLNEEIVSESDKEQCLIGAELAFSYLLNLNI